MYGLRGHRNPNLTSKSHIAVQRHVHSDIDERNLFPQEEIDDHLFRFGIIDSEKDETHVAKFCQLLCSYVVGMPHYALTHAVVDRSEPIGLLRVRELRLGRSTRCAKGIVQFELVAVEEVDLPHGRLGEEVEDVRPCATDPNIRQL